MYILRSLIGVVACVLALVMVICGAYIVLSDGFGIVYKISTSLFCAIMAYTFWSWGFSVFKVLKYEKKYIREHGMDGFNEMKRNSPLYSRKAYNEYVKRKEG